MKVFLMVEDTLARVRRIFRRSSAPHSSRWQTRRSRVNRQPSGRLKIRVGVYQIRACVRRRWFYGDGGNFLQRKVDRSFFAVGVLIQIFVGSLYRNRLSRIEVYIEFRRKKVFDRTTLEYDGYSVQCFSLPFTNRDPVYSRIPNRAVDAPRRPGRSRHSHPGAVPTTVCLPATAKLPLGRRRQAFCDAAERASRFAYAGTLACSLAAGNRSCGPGRDFKGRLGIELFSGYP